ncbi:hypothetical protein BN946_scf184804.g21 [Trametes cinnabarina]|uniref:Uncharacterized protein n=1 Tax=Pycnoporus cinnabarinus TaxID=5643 RepID=A0A060SF76_PYCCI|nr:hypothetical protein BN946_scf184804.g21 [Trametes cinnabarina]
MSEHLNSEEEDLLQAGVAQVSALQTAFSPAPLPRQSAAPEPAPQPVAGSSSTPPPVAEPQSDASAATGEAESTEDAWKEEYEAYVAEWRKRSAEQRQQAEERRAHWEAIRAKEREEGKGKDSVLSLREHGWENLSSSVTTVATAAESPSPADARDLVTGEAQGGHSKEYLESVLPGAHASASSSPPDHENSQPASEPESKQEKWDDMTSSLTSSFPSMSFPSDPHSPSSSARRDLPPPPHHHQHPHPADHAHGPGHLHGHHHHHHEGAEGQRTATLSVFDSSLSPKTRALALFSSLAINLLLPFVNGVMLGFGEIFAKNVVRWIGWKVPGTASSAKQQGSGRVATSVGLGSK